MSIPQLTEVKKDYSSGYAPLKPIIPQKVIRPANFHSAKKQSSSFTDHLDSLNATLWHRADGWTNGTPFNCGWRADHVSFQSGKMVLTLDNTPSSGKPYTSGEYRTNKFYGYGTLEASIKAVVADGVMGGSLFFHTGPWDGNPHDEIDIEFVKGKLQVNYFTNGVGGHETVIDLGFDPSLGFHTYKIGWLANRITWSVDGVAVHSEDGSNGTLPSTPGRIMANLWPGDGSVDPWLGSFTYTSPLKVEYDWISYTPYSAPSSPTTPITLTKSTAPVDKPTAVPNPFTGPLGTWITYQQPINEVKIYNTAGELVTTLRQDNINSRQIHWNGQNRSGAEVAEGLYIYAIRTEGKKSVKGKIVKN